MPKSEQAPGVTDEEIARFRAIADPIRLELVEALELRGPLTSKELRQLASTRSIIHHLRVLRDAGFIESVEGETDTWQLTSNPGPVLAWDEAAARDPRVELLIRELERISTERRSRRLARFDKEVEDGKWPEEWAAAAIGRDYLLSMSLDDLSELDERWRAMMEEFKDRCRPGKSVAAGAGQDVFVTISAFPIRLGPSV